MKTIYLLAVVFFCQIVWCQQNDSKQNQFIVTGSIELKEVADQASVNFSIKGTGSTLRQAVEQADTKTKALTDKLIDLGIKPRNISTSQFYSGENNGDKAFLSSSKDFRAIIETSVKIDSLQLLQPVLFTISEAQVDRLSQIAFSYKDESGLRRRARIEAGLKAREKADDLAKALGVVIGKVISIEEILPGQTVSPNSMQRSNFNYPNPFNPTTLSELSGETSGSGFFAQTISVTSQVRVIFEIK